MANPGQVYLVYLGYVPTTELDLRDAEGSFQIQWFNPREGGPMQDGAVTAVKGGRKVSLGAPPSDPDQDWVVLVRAR
jgi:hypothetical protein